jgi:demethylmenaquinone methyltransferase/2-methoxy-6-polyprenyl-1,4-benzoquinol methylase
VSERGQRLYDRWSRHVRAFDLLYGVVFLGREREFRRRSVAALDLDRGDTVLELGCGPGNSFETLREAVGDAGTVLGVDYSTGMVRRASERIDSAGWANVHTLAGDAENLPVDAESVDAVYASMSLSAVPDPRAAAREAARVLRPAGRIAVLDARPFQRGLWRALNPIVVPVSTWLTDWNAGVDIVEVLNDVFADVSVFKSTGGGVVVVEASDISAGSPR